MKGLMKGSLFGSIAAVALLALCSMPALAQEQSKPENEGKNKPANRTPGDTISGLQAWMAEINSKLDAIRQDVAKLAQKQAVQAQTGMGAPPPPTPPLPPASTPPPPPKTYKVQIKVYSNENKELNQILTYASDKIQCSSVLIVKTGGSEPLELVGTMEVAGTLEPPISGNKFVFSYELVLNVPRLVNVAPGGKVGSQDQQLIPSGMHGKTTIRYGQEKELARCGEYLGQGPRNAGGIAPRQAEDRGIVNRTPEAA